MESLCSEFEVPGQSAKPNALSYAASESNKMRAQRSTINCCQFQRVSGRDEARRTIRENTTAVINVRNPPQSVIHIGIMLCSYPRRWPSGKYQSASTNQAAAAPTANNSVAMRTRCRGAIVAPTATKKNAATAYTIPERTSNGTIPSSVVGLTHLPIAFPEANTPAQLPTDKIGTKIQRTECERFIRIRLDWWP